MAHNWRWLAVVALLLGGCTSSFETYFVPETTQPLGPPLQHARVIRTGEEDPEQARIRLYPQARVLGRSTFTGTNQNVDQLCEFAASIGADLALWQNMYLNTIVETKYDRHTDTDVTNVSTRHADGSVTKTKIRQEDTAYVPRTDTRHMYRHNVIFLRTY